MKQVRYLWQQVASYEIVAPLDDETGEAGIGTSRQLVQGGVDAEQVASGYFSSNYFRPRQSVNLSSSKAIWPTHPSP